MVVKSILFIVVLCAFQTDKPTSLLFFGDSLTAGYGLSPEEAFPALIEKELNKKERVARVAKHQLVAWLESIGCSENQLTFSY
jgi:acyl-CoA thioesterase-1